MARSTNSRAGRGFGIFTSESSMLLEPTRCIKISPFGGLLPNDRPSVHDPAALVATPFFVSAGNRYQYPRLFESHLVIPRQRDRKEKTVVQIIDDRSSHFP
jgi:hypothetical protein